MTKKAKRPVRTRLYQNPKDELRTGQTVTIVRDMGWGHFTLEVLFPDGKTEWVHRSKLKTTAAHV